MSLRFTLRHLLLALFVLSGASVASAQSPPAASPTGGERAIATFAGGCFWCVESDFDKVDGVLETVSGFMGGKTKNPTYQQVSAGGTGYAEAVQVTYDPTKVSYTRLLDVFWRSIDPLDAGGQFCDRGDQYRSAIFTHTAEQQRLAEASKKALDNSKRFKQPIVTEITPVGEFTRAEEYHQKYYQKNPIRYHYYRASCGRDARLKALWGAEAGGKLATQ
jgi:peptide-methionine (S)-S-oxide reductase